MRVTASARAGLPRVPTLVFTSACVSSRRFPLESRPCPREFCRVTTRVSASARASQFLREPWRVPTRVPASARFSSASTLSELPARLTASAHAIFREYPREVSQVALVPWRELRGTSQQLEWALAAARVGTSAVTRLGAKNTRGTDAGARETSRGN